MFLLLLIIALTHVLSAYPGVSSSDKFNWRLYNLTTNTDNSSTGYVQVQKVCGPWGTVCDDHMTNVTAGVMCHWLGFDKVIDWCSVLSDTCRITTELTEFPINLDNLYCKAGAANLSDCDDYIWGEGHNCGHNEDLVLTCGNDTSVDVDDELDDLSNTTITKENAQEVADKLLILSKKSQGISPQGLSQLTGIIEGLVGTKMSELGQSVAETLSNILDVKGDVLRDAQKEGNVTGRIVSSLEKVAVLLDPDIPIQTKNLKLSAAVVSSCTPIRHSSDSNVTLPDLGGETKGKTAYLISYSNRKLFPTNHSTGFASHNFSTTNHRTAISSNNHIVSIGVHNKSINNLKTPVSMMFRLDNISNNDSAWYPRCVYYRPSIISQHSDNPFGSWDDVGVQTKVNKHGTVTCLSSHLTSFSLMWGTQPPGGSTHQSILDILTYVCLALSMLGLVLTIIALALPPSLRRTNVTRVHINLALSLLVAYIIFLTEVGAEENIKNTDTLCTPKPPKTLCVVKACLMQYAFLSAFSWMAVEAYTLYLQFVKIFPTSSTGFITKCTIVSTLVPLVFTSSSLAAALATDLGTCYDREYCWLRGFALYLGFILPIVVIVIGNTAVFILAARNVYKGTKEDAEMNDFTVQARAAVSVLVLLGVTWMFGAFTIKDGEESARAVVFQYVFTVLNGLQGLGIFTFHVLLKPNVVKAWRVTFEKKKLEVFDLLDMVGPVKKGCDEPKTEVEEAPYEAVGGLKRGSTKVKVQPDTMVVIGF